jgi:hypothetical protein
MENPQQSKKKPVDSNTFLSISETSTKEEFSKALLCLTTSMAEE